MAKKDDKKASKKGTVKMHRKISTKTLGWTQKQIVAALADVENGESVHLYGIAGVATGMKTGESTYGTWVAFIGDFAASVAGEKEPVRSPKCFIPQPFQDMLESQLLQCGGTPVEFAVHIYATKNEEATTGYEFTVEPVVKMSEADQVGKLLEQLAD